MILLFKIIISVLCVGHHMTAVYTAPEAAAPMRVPAWLLHGAFLPLTGISDAYRRAGAVELAVRERKRELCATGHEQQQQCSAIDAESWAEHNRLCNIVAAANVYGHHPRDF